MESEQYKLHHPEGFWAHVGHRQVVCPALFCVGDLHHLSHTALLRSSQVSIFWGAVETQQEREGDILIWAMMTSSVALNLSAFLSDAFKLQQTQCGTRDNIEAHN